MEGPFGLVVVAVDDCVELPALPSTATARRLAGLLGPYGAEPPAPLPATTAPAVREYLGAWSKAEGGPASSFVYWVGHGESDGVDQWLLSSGSSPPYTVADTVPATELAENLMTRWSTRVEADDGAWTVLVLDCCNAGVGTSNIVHRLTAQADCVPGRLAILRVASGASTVGRFVDELEAALAATTENDDTIPLNSLLWEVTRRLGEGLQPILWLPFDAALVNPRRTRTVVAMNVDLLDEWRRLVDGLPPETRAHFVDKAQSAEVGELAWHFSGRHREMRELAAWLRDQAGGMLVVTGEPGAGKSAPGRRRPVRARRCRRARPAGHRPGRRPRRVPGADGARRDAAAAARRASRRAGDRGHPAVAARSPGPSRAGELRAARRARGHRRRLHLPAPGAGGDG